MKWQKIDYNPNTAKPFIMEYNLLVKTANSSVVIKKISQTIISKYTNELGLEAELEV